MDYALSEPAEDKVFTTEEHAWECLRPKNKTERIFFKYLSIARDGGMSEIGVKPELWYSTRPISALMLIVFCIYNVHCVFTIDISIVSPDYPSTDNYLLTPWLLGGVLHQIFGPLAALVTEYPVKLMAYIEMLGVSFILAKALLNVVRIYGKTDYAKWQAVVDLCWGDLPSISIASTLKILSRIAPQQLSYDLFFILFYDFSWAHLAFFVVSRPLMLMVGFDCFLIKFRAVSTFIDGSDVQFTNLTQAIIFMTQVIGVVNMNRTIKDRLYRFVFAGEDGVMSPTEKTRQRVWEAMTAESIFTSYTPLRAASLMLSWCDDDFQLLLLNEHKPPRTTRSGTLMMFNTFSLPAMSASTRNLNKNLDQD